MLASNKTSSSKDTKVMKQASIVYGVFVVLSNCFETVEFFQFFNYIFSEFGEINVTGIKEPCNYSNGLV